MQVGSVIAYRERGHLALGVVQKLFPATGRAQVEILGADGRKQVLSADRIICDCGTTLPSTLSPADVKKRLQELLDHINAHAQTINVEELWELLKEETEEFSWEDLAGFVLSAPDDPVAKVSLLAALWAHPVYFKEKKAGFFTPRDPQSVAESLHQQHLETQRVQAHNAFLAWVHARLAGAAPPAPPPAGGERYLQLLKELALYGDTYEKKSHALSLLEAIGFRGKGHPWDVAFQLLVALGIWQEDEELCILRYRIPTRFPQDVLAAAAQIPPFTASQGYTDLTSLSTFTIDDPDTTEVDDALSLHQENGVTLVGIHITDASFFVSPGSLIDQAALTRGTTVYLPRGKLPMLPPTLSEDKASLVVGELRPTLSFFASVDPAGHLQAERICRGVIRVGQRLSYAEADALLRSPDSSPTAAALKQLSALAQARRAVRASQGAVIIEGDEVKVRVHDGEVTVTLLTNDSPSRTLVSECMILANEMAARYCQAHRLPALYIAQPPPDEPVPAVEAFPTPRVYVHAARRLMKPAQLGTTPAPHAALGLDLYTQVTSPLRRYHDLQMQHQIKHHLQHGTALFDEAQLQIIAAGAQESSLAAKRCERESTRYWLLRFLEHKKGHTVSGQVVREHHGRSFIELDDTLLVVPVNVSPPLPLGTAVTVVIAHVDARRDILSVRLA
ncbi:MAG: ribonuclease R [Candidatus Binatia bacterium]|nr:ribonuclease R [Candidatus Binatia bacterium]